MIKLQNRQGFEIKEVKCQEQEDRYVLTWKYQKGSHFLIVLSDARRNLNPESEWKGISEQNFQALVENGEYRTDNFLMLLIEEVGLSSAGKKYELMKSDAVKYLPGKVQVFACTLDVDKLNVYRSAEKESIIYLKIAVNAVVSYKKIWFTRKKRCTFHVDYIEDYEEGMVCYRIMEDAGIFPLTELALGRTLLVVMLRPYSLNLFISEKYKNWYELNEVVR